MIVTFTYSPWGLGLDIMTREVVLGQPGILSPTERTSHIRFSPWFFEPENTKGVFSAIRSWLMRTFSFPFTMKYPVGSYGHSMARWRLSERRQYSDPTMMGMFPSWTPLMVLASVRVDPSGRVWNASISTSATSGDA